MKTTSTLHCRRVILKPDFFNRSTELVARELLGKFLVRRLHGRRTAVCINEVEVYDGFKDKGSHASRGRTARNAPMFGPPGCWYVYLTYGMHWMLNVVTRETDYPAAILIRGGVVAGKSMNRLSEANLNGPAKLTKFLGIDAGLNDMPAVIRTGLWLEDRGRDIGAADIKKGPRVGIDYAGPYWAKRQLGFRTNLSGKQVRHTKRKTI